MKNFSKLILIILITFQINCALHNNSELNILSLIKDDSDSDQAIQEIITLEKEQLNNIIKVIFKNTKYRKFFDELIKREYAKIWFAAMANKDFDCMEYIITSVAVKPHFIVSECKNGNLDIMKYMLNNNRYLMNRLDYKGYDLFHIACEYGYLEIVKFLLSWHSGLNSLTHLAKTPLHIACYKGHFSVVKELLKYGPELELQDNIGLSPLGAALHSNHIDIAIFLLRNGATFPKNISCHMKLAPILRFLKKLDTDIKRYIPIENLGKFRKDQHIIHILLQQSICLNMPEYDAIIESFNNFRDNLSNFMIISNLDNIKTVIPEDISMLFSNSQIAAIIVQKLYSDNYDDLAMKELIKKVAMKYSLKDLFYNDNNIIWEALALCKRDLAILILFISPDVLEYLPRELHYNNSLLLFDIYAELISPKTKA